LQGFSRDPRCKAGINDGTGTGSSETSATKLPIGLPFTFAENGSASGSSSSAPASDSKKIVYTFDMPSDIGPEALHATHSAFQQARTMNASCVLIRMNSYSGALDAAENIRQEILDYDRPVMIYVENREMTASNLISTACDSVYLRHAPKVPRATAPSRNAVASPAGDDKDPATDLEQETHSTASLRSLPLDQECRPASKLRGEASDINDVLLHAGLRDCKVVHYNPGFLSKAIDFLMRRPMSLLLVVLLAFGLSLQRKESLPGPSTFIVLVSSGFFVLPLFMGGLATGKEIALFAASVLATILLNRGRQKLWLRLLPVAALLLLLTLCQYTRLSFSYDSDLTVLLLLTSLSFFAGWNIPVMLRFFPGRQVPVPVRIRK
ncbi:MAG TPA: hypothetical protein VFU15_03350, partial [Bacteroidia bacterium]|nr:hypothetical protein [Bacteroidia bacterium]